MDWVKANIGKTLEDAVNEYQGLEKRMENPGFERKFAASNMFNKYKRNFIKNNPNSSLKDVREFWSLKKQIPTIDGFVMYEKTDLKLRRKITMHNIGYKT